MTARKLMFDAVPTSAASPLRREFKTVWGTVRRTLLKEHGSVCMACEHAPEHVHELEAHEVFSFPSAGALRLERVTLLCRKCHHTVHLERSAYQARVRGYREAERSGLKLRKAKQAGYEAEQMYRVAMIEHYCKVNGVSAERCEKDLRLACPPKGWGIKLGGKATMDYGPYKGLVDSFLARRDADGGQRWQRQRQAGLIREAERRDEDQDRAGPFEMLPDHECPEDTAMWRDTFG